MGLCCYGMDAYSFFFCSSFLSARLRSDRCVIVAIYITYKRERE